MTVTVELSPRTEARFREQAQKRGVSLESAIQDYLMRQFEGTPPGISYEQDPEEWEKALDHLSDGFSSTEVPLPEHALTREYVYTREDDL